MSQPAIDLIALRERIRAGSHADEGEAVAELIRLAAETLTVRQRRDALEQAREITRRCREQADDAGTLDAFLHEFGLSNPEGVALMCLAEALLRVPDEDTADRLIAEKIRAGNWESHLGHSESLFVNGSVWGLMLTGRLVTVDSDTLRDPGAWVRRLVSRLGEPIVRAAIMQAMRILARQYVLGRTIDEALERSREGDGAGDLFSFDMLGEGARTWPDADRYFSAYRDAIDAIGRQATGADPRHNDGISVKLSALHPRFETAHRADVLENLPERLGELAMLARDHGLGLTIDAEEAARLELTMDVFEHLARNPSLRDWDGLGFVLQAYQKRAPAVANWLVALGRDTGRSFMVRLVKGAYWDAEIKHAQVEGYPDYPVFTRKANTDLAYEVCAGRLAAAGDRLHLQFATHNATTACQMLTFARDRGLSFELQRLHGMGELLYQALYRDLPEPRVPLRVYAPVGSHRDLLPYLVRRLLENGANSSFVNRFLDNDVAVTELIRDPLEQVQSASQPRHPRIPVPPDLYRAAGEPRTNSLGMDLDDPVVLDGWVTGNQARLIALQAEPAQAAPTQPLPGGIDPRPVHAPADRSLLVGYVREASDAEVEAALERADAASPEWRALSADARAQILEQVAQRLEAERDALMFLIGMEGGRTAADAHSEVREAVDFCRYYAWRARCQLSPKPLPGPTGEENVLHHEGRGTFACISPWNFPLAIFTGQITAALAAGNCVLAKPAEQTPLVAARAVDLMHDAGVPHAVLQLLPGDGARIGARLTSDERVHGIAFTGSTETAWLINRQLAARNGPIVPFIAETGGQNVMIADTTALPEQLVDDVITSAFRSAGQRCSALRVLYLPEEIADPVLAMLAGAMDTLTIGDPLDPATDVGPIIDAGAVSALTAHAESLGTDRLIHRCTLGKGCENGTFFPPQAYEIERIGELPGEVFGPIVHVIRYRRQDLGRIIDEVNGTGFGLTLGVHSRIEGFARDIFRGIRAGNTYVNRNMIGAVVGVQPFGGTGLSGTGPKAGGPETLLRFATERTFTDNITARGGNAALFELDERA